MRYSSELPNIARIGALIGNPMRAHFISMLMDGSRAGKQAPVYSRDGGRSDGFSSVRNRFAKVSVGRTGTGERKGRGGIETTR